MYQHVKHSKIADGIDQIVTEKKFVPAGIDADQVGYKVDIG